MNSHIQEILINEVSHQMLEEMLVKDEFQTFLCNIKESNKNGRYVDSELQLFDMLEKYVFPFCIDFLGKDEVDE